MLYNVPGVAVVSSTDGATPCRARRTDVDLCHGLVFKGTTPSFYGLLVTGAVDNRLAVAARYERFRDNDYYRA